MAPYSPRFREVASVNAWDRCYFIAERTENDSITHTPIRIQNVAVERHGDFGIMRETMGWASEFLGCPQEITLLCPDPITVERALAQIEVLRSQRPAMLPGIPVKIGGETFVDAEHPALEVIPNGDSPSNGTVTSYRPAP